MPLWCRWIIDEMETAPEVFGDFVEGSLFRPEIFEEDLEKILSLYNDIGFLERPFLKKMYNFKSR